MIRTLTAADLTAVSSIDEKSFFDVWSPSMWLDELNNSLTTYLVLEDAGRILGYAGFWLVAGEAQITRVAVASEEREQSIGKRLRESNIAAQKVYLTCGFASEGIRPNYYEDNHENAIIMWLYKEGKPDV